MAKTLKVGLAGLGFMGRMHFGCYSKSPRAHVVAVCDGRAKNFVATRASGNIEGAAELDLTGLRTFTDIDEMLADPSIDMVDVCAPTSQHAAITEKALRAGKHVLCEKPMAASLAECDAMIEAARQSGKLLMIGHCLRFWPEYVAAHELIQAGELGAILYARFHRSTAAPRWSSWMLDEKRSGGAVLDTHIHDVDIALWWFGRPDRVSATGVAHNGLSLKVDAHWFYQNGPQLNLHCGWDLNGGPFRAAFEVTGETGTLSWDSALEAPMQWVRDQCSHAVEVGASTGYQAEIDYFVDCILEGRTPERATPQSSRLTTEITLEEMRQLNLA